MEQSLKDLDKAFEAMLKKFPDARREVVENAGEKMQRKVLQNISATTKEVTGRLIEGVTLAVGSGGGYAAVRNDAKIAPHAHLVENGHKLVRGGPIKVPKKELQSTNPRSTGAVVGWVPGKHMYRNAMNDLEDELIGDAEEMVEKLVGDLF